jgi:predicted transcriptional regulator with HTH domain
MNFGQLSSKTVIYTALTIAAHLHFLAPDSLALQEHSGDVRITLNQIRQDSRSEIITVKGSIHCTLGSENTGESCVLTLKETGTGKIYRITQKTREAMQLLSDGFTQVSVDGSFAGSDAFEIRSIRAL